MHTFSITNNVWLFSLHQETCSHDEDTYRKKNKYAYHYTLSIKLGGTTCQMLKHYMYQT